MIYGNRALLTLFCLAFLWAGQGQSPVQARPLLVTIPSQAPGPSAIDNTIYLEFFPAAGIAASPAPAVVLLHPIGEGENDLLSRFMDSLGQKIANRGINVALMTLPYHLQRTPPGDFPLRHFLGPRVSDIAQALNQGQSDVETTAEWLRKRPGVDPSKIGVVGISLGAIIAHLAMGEHVDLADGVCFMGAGDLPDLYEHSEEVKLHGYFVPNMVTPEALAALKPVEPETYADINRPRHVLMVEAARDLYVPPRDAEELWNALGRPPIEWVDTDHFTFIAFPDKLAETAANYLERQWNGGPNSIQGLPRLDIPTFKFGLLSGLDERVTFAATWQAYSFASRPDHLSLWNLDLGLSGRGPFVGAAITLNPYLDIGIGRRLLGHDFRPYLSLHFVP